MENPLFSNIVAGSINTYKVEVPVLVLRELVLWFVYTRPMAKKQGKYTKLAPK